MGLPTLPCLVVTMMAPLAARAPYMAADASFNTEMSSMSLALKRAKPPALSGIPSNNDQGTGIPCGIYAPYGNVRRIGTRFPCGLYRHKSGQPTCQ